MPSQKILSRFLCASLLGLMLAPTITAQETLTNQDVIRLAKLGLSAEIINAKIAQSPANFDLSVDGLTALAQNKVPNEVIKAMQAKSSNAPLAKSSVGADKNANEPKAVQNASSIPLPPDKGTYLWDGKQLHLLRQSEATSTGQNILRTITPGVKKKMEVQLIGGQAKTVFELNQPTILVSGLGEVVPGVPSFRLLQIKTGGMRKDRRIVGTYDISVFSGSVSRVDNEIECTVKKMADGIYAFTPAKPLGDGEYGFAQATGAATAINIWDFGIYAEGRPAGNK
jgi:hypothetical protein